MALHHPLGIDERILLMGGSGAGKTRAWLSIADMARKTRSDAKFYVVDTDFAVRRMLAEGFPALRESDTVVLYEVTGWEDYIKAATDIQRKAQENDWVIVDLMNKAWDESQSYFTQQIFGQSQGDYFLEVRKAMKADAKMLQTFEGYTDWIVIKAMYQDFANRALVAHRGHTLICTGTKPVTRQGKMADSKDVVQTFGHLGHKPEGEKHLPHAVHTVLMLSQKSDDVWVFDTGKDRERERVRGVTMGPEDGQFVRKYLVDVAGWKLA